MHDKGVCQTSSYYVIIMHILCKHSRVDHKCKTIAPYMHLIHRILPYGCTINILVNMTEQTIKKCSKSN